MKFPGGLLRARAGLLFDVGALSHRWDAAQAAPTRPVSERRVSQRRGQQRRAGRARLRPEGLQQPAPSPGNRKLQKTPAIGFGLSNTLISKEAPTPKGEFVFQPVHLERSRSGLYQVTGVKRRRPSSAFTVPANL